MQPMIALVCVLVLVVVAYWILRPRPAPPTPTCVSARGAPGTCDTDSDCNAPNGACQKNSEGACVCVCAPGYSGTKCQTKGIPYNSYQCMGPNKVPPNPPPGNKNGMCVCPPGSWASGVDPTTGQWVQCLGCAEGWGPLGASSGRTARSYTRTTATRQTSVKRVAPSSASLPAKQGPTEKKAARATRANSVRRPALREILPAALARPPEAAPK